MKAWIILVTYTYLGYIICSLVEYDFQYAMQFIAIHMTIILGIGFWYMLARELK